MSRLRRTGRGNLWLPYLGPYSRYDLQIWKPHLTLSGTSSLGTALSSSLLGEASRTLGAMSQHPTDTVVPRGINHLRLTVTDIGRSKAFYSTLLGRAPVIDESASVDEPGVREDQSRVYGGVVYSFGDQVLGLRPVAEAGDTFSSTRVGLDHVGLLVDSRADLEAAAERLSADGVPHGEITDLGSMVILSLQDPDDINLELCCPEG
jgi:glyoxylase I family protein